MTHIAPAAYAEYASTQIKHLKDDDTHNIHALSNLLRSIAAADRLESDNAYNDNIVYTAGKVRDYLEEYSNQLDNQGLDLPTTMKKMSAISNLLTRTSNFLESQKPSDIRSTPRKLSFDTSKNTEVKVTKWVADTYGKWIDPRDREAEPEYVQEDPKTSEEHDAEVTAGLDDLFASLGIEE